MLSACPPWCGPAMVLGDCVVALVRLELSRAAVVLRGLRRGAALAPVSVYGPTKPQAWSAWHGGRFGRVPSCVTAASCRATVRGQRVARRPELVARRGGCVFSPSPPFSLVTGDLSFRAAGRELPARAAGRELVERPAALVDSRASPWWCCFRLRRRCRPWARVCRAWCPLRGADGCGAVRRLVRSPAGDRWG